MSNCVLCQYQLNQPLFRDFLGHYVSEDGEVAFLFRLKTPNIVWLALPRAP